MHNNLLALPSRSERPLGEYTEQRRLQVASDLSIWTAQAHLSCIQHPKCMAVKGSQHQYLSPFHGIASAAGSTSITLQPLEGIAGIRGRLVRMSIGHLLDRTVQLQGYECHRYRGSDTYKRIMATSVCKGVFLFSLAWEHAVYECMADA